MTSPGHPDTEELLRRLGEGDASAGDRLLARHRDRLKQMVAVRMDSRLAARIDPSDVVQETLLQASRKLCAYAAERPLPFYPWLRQMAWERLEHLHRRHVRAKKRSVVREEACHLMLSDESVARLARRLVSSRTSPSRDVLRDESRRRVVEALEQLKERDREVLVLRYLEQLSAREVAAVLGISEGATLMRQFRALERLRKLLGLEREGYDR